MLRTKCILLPRGPEDGYRISVMSRHTLTDGTTPDLRIAEDAFNDWWRTLAPPRTLIGDYHKRGMLWERFEDRYRDYLRNAVQQQKLKDLIWYANRETITILCIEKAPEQCHRRLIAEECERLWKGLEVRVD